MTSKQCDAEPSNGQWTLQWNVEWMKVTLPPHTDQPQCFFPVLTEIASDHSAVFDSILVFAIKIITFNVMAESLTK